FLARRVTENESVIELDLFHQISRAAVIVLVFAGKTDDDVGRNRDSIAGRAYSVDERAIFVGGVGPMHRLEDSIRTGLEREMDVFGKLGQFCKSLQQIVAKPDRVR